MIIEYRGIRPKLGLDVFLAQGVILLGDIEIGDYSNLWFYTVARADVNYIRIGAQTNIQDHCALHVTTDKFPLVIGAEVVVGHRAVIHGATIHDRALIGIGALVLDGSVVEEGAIVGSRRGRKSRKRHTCQQSGDRNSCAPSPGLHGGRARVSFNKLFKI